MKLQLRAIRKKSRISQEELAKRVGVSSRAVGAWERGENLPNAEQIWNCAIALDSTPNDLMGWYLEHPRTRSQPTDPDEHELLEDYRACSGQWKDQVLMSARAAAVTSGSFSEPAVPSAQEA